MSIFDFGDMDGEDVDYLFSLIEDGDFEGAFDELGQTDCEEGCYVEPDGRCPHGYKSLGLRLGIM